MGSGRGGGGGIVEKSLKLAVVLSLLSLVSPEHLKTPLRYLVSCLKCDYFQR